MVPVDNVNEKTVCFFGNTKACTAVGSFFIPPALEQLASFGTDRSTDSDMLEKFPQQKKMRQPHRRLM